MKKLGKNFLVSWKTTSAGILMIVGGICALIFAPAIDQAVIMGAVTAILGGVGLMFAKDGNVTGGTKDSGQTPKEPKSI